MNSRLAAARKDNMKRLLNPDSVVLIGGRNLVNSIDLLKCAGYIGTIHIVNPTRLEIGGILCVPSVKDLPVAPDAAFISVNRNLTVRALAELSEIGAGGAVCFAAGFSEMGDSGKQLESQLISAAGSMAVVGPNSNGLLNRLDRLALWPMNDHKPFVTDRGVAIIAQSGGVAQMFIRDRRGHRPAIIVSTGNQTILGPADWLDLLGADERITAIGLFLEGPGDVVSIARAAATTRARGVPVVVMKSGRSALGMQMASTHTGSMAGDDELFTSLCDRLGFIRARTLSSFSETLKALEAWKGLSGNRMAVLTASGAACAMFADTCGDEGIQLPTPSDQMAARLRPQLPDFAHVANPLDYNAAYTGAVGLTEENEAALYECFKTFLLDGFDVGIMHSDWTDQGPEGSPTLRAWAKAAADTRTPAAVVTLMAENMSEDTNLFCRRNGLAALQGEEHACAAVAASMKYGEISRNATIVDFWVLPKPPVLIGMTKLHDEADSKDILSRAGVPFPLRKVTRFDRLTEAAHSIGYPVVLKAISSSIPHKHLVGAVALGIKDSTDLQHAANEMRAKLVKIDLRPESYLVESMIENVVAELIIGIKYSPIYGHALIIGEGGVGADKSSELSAMLLPVDRNYVERSLRRLHIANKISQKAISSILDIAMIVAKFALANSDKLSALDLNPLVVTRDEHVIAVDALLELSEPK